MDGFHKRFYRFNWGCKPDGSPRGEDELRELNEALAECLAWLLWLSFAVAIVLLVLQRVGVVPWTGVWSLMLFPFFLMGFCSLHPTVRRILFAPMKLDAEGYARYMATYKKRMWIGALIMFAMYLLLFSDDWQEGWGTLVAKAVFATVCFEVLSYVFTRMGARRALARHEKEMAEGGE